MMRGYDDWKLATPPEYEEEPDLIEAADIACSEACEAVHDCTVCHRRKKPIGRDSMDDGLCDHECPGYRLDPHPGHLWPGEFERSREP